MTDPGVTEVEHDPPADDEVTSEPLVLIEPLPTGPRERLIQVACGIGVLFDAVSFYVTLPLVGYLLTRPLQAEIIRPSGAAVIIGGAYAKVGLEPVWAVLLLSLVGFMIWHPLRWLAGHRYGDPVALFMTGNNPKLARRIERFVDRWGVWGLWLGWFLPVPMILVQIGAGTSGMSFKRFIVADVGGVVLYIAALFTLGYSVGQPAVRVVKRIGHYSLLVTIGFIVVVVIYSVIKQSRAQRA